MEHSDNKFTSPVYNIKAVSRMVGLLPVTLRAWERRYGLPQPRRGDQGYRLYSEYDLQTLRWIKNQVEAGMSISRAVEYLNELRQAGKDPAAHPVTLSPELPPSTEAFSRSLFQALSQYNESSATEIIRRAFTLYSLDQVLIEVIQPVLVEMGEAWHRGELPIAVEHFSTQFCKQHLMSLLAASAPPSREGLIVAACAPGESHEIGLLMLVAMLRWRGWEVKYLGPNLELEGLATALAPLRPRMLMFTATRPESARQLERLPQVLAQFQQAKPLVVVGGQAFRAYRLPGEVPAFYLDSSPTATIGLIERLLQQS